MGEKATKVCCQTVWEIIDFEPQYNVIANSDKILKIFSVHRFKLHFPSSGSGGVYAGTDSFREAKPYFAGAERAFSHSPRTELPQEFSGECEKPREGTIPNE